MDHGLAVRKSARCNATVYRCPSSLKSTVKPPIKDTLKEDKSSNKGQTESTLHTLYKIISERGQPLYKGLVPRMSLLRGSTYIKAARSAYLRVEIFKGFAVYFKNFAGTGSIRKYEYQLPICEIDIENESPIREIYNP